MDGKSAWIALDTMGSTRAPLGRTGFAKESGYKNAALAAVAALCMQVSNASHKHWVFTTFVVTLLEQLPVVFDSEEPPVYLCCQVERCPETGREHLQGYVEFAQRVGLRTVKLKLGDPTMHLEPRRGSPRWG